MPQPLNEMPLSKPCKAVFSNASHKMYVYGERRETTRHAEGEAPQIMDTFKAVGVLPEYPYTLEGYQA